MVNIYDVTVCLSLMPCIHFTRRLRSQNIHHDYVHHPHAYFIICTYINRKFDQLETIQP